MPSDVNFKCYAEGREGKSFVEILMHRQNKKNIVHPPFYTIYYCNIPYRRYFYYCAWKIRIIVNCSTKAPHPVLPIAPEANAQFQ